MHNWTRCTKRWLYLRSLRPRRYSGCQATLLRNLGPMAVAVTAEFLDQLDTLVGQLIDETTVMLENENKIPILILFATLLLFAVPSLVILRS